MKETFTKSLEDFARKEKDQIKKNPYFREKFNELSQILGINPIVCKHLFLLWFNDFLARKTILSEFGFGDYYIELSVKEQLLIS